jgi:2-dehydro-3-deoxyphosphooctonate aldolase (KDO 8-P synthase)
METHPDPENAMSDGPNSWPMHEIKELLITLMQIDSVVKPNLV